MLNRNHTLEEKNKISQSLKKAYSEGRKKNILSKEIKKKISNTLKEKYSSGKIIHWLKDKKGYVNSGSFEKGHKINLGKKMNPNSIKQAVLTRRLKGSYNNHHKIIERCFGKTYEEIYGKEKAQIIKNKIGIKSSNRSSLTLNKIKESRKYQIIPFKDTFIEKKIQNYLKELHIEFFTHQYMDEINHGYQCDIFIPTQKSNYFFIKQPIIIECDGDFFHCNPKFYSSDFVRFPNGKDKKTAELIWKQDKTRTEELINHGYRIIRLWESDIKQLNVDTFKTII